MCCGLFDSGPALAHLSFGAFWWLFQPVRWEAAFNNWAGGSLWWIWPVLGIIFVPWTTIMYVIVAPGGVNGWDWLWIWARPVWRHRLVQRRCRPQAHPQLPRLLSKFGTGATAWPKRPTLARRTLSSLRGCGPKERNSKQPHG